MTSRGSVEATLQVSEKSMSMIIFFQSMAQAQLDQSGRRKRVSGEMEVRDNKVILKIQGLDTWGIDPQNIKIVDVDSLDAEEEEEEEEPTLLGLKRLKIVGLCRQQKDFKTSGCYSEKFRKKYSDC